MLTSLENTNNLVINHATKVLDQSLKETKDGKINSKVIKSK